MRPSRGKIAVALLAAGGATGPSTAQGQLAAADRTAAEARWEAGASLTANLLVGGSDFLDSGLGFLAFAGRNATGPLWIRGDVLYFGLDADEDLSEGADNAILSFGVGPEIDAGWSWLRGYLRGYLGLALNLQSRSRSDLPTGTSSAGVFGGGAGLRIRFRTGPRPIAADLGLDILKIGELEFARRRVAGGILTEDTGVISLRAGLMLGFP